MKWIEICIESNMDITEEVSMVLLEAGSNGTQIQNPDEIKSLIDDAGAKELADYGDFSSILDKYRTIAYFTTETNLETIKTTLNESLNGGAESYKFLWREVDDEDWKGNWKKYYKPFQLTEKINIVPSWEVSEAVDDYTIIMDPGMAFGTGTHESTSLCAGMIEKYLKTGDVFLDIGTGTGILSILAMKLGAQSALAIDIDSAAVKTAKQNFEINKTANADVFHGELKDIAVIKHFKYNASIDLYGQFDMIAANIVSDVIIILAEDMKKYLKKGGSLVCSGIIKERENDVKKALIKAGFGNLIIETKNEWTAITADA